MHYLLNHWRRTLTLLSATALLGACTTMSPEGAIEEGRIEKRDIASAAAGSHDRKSVVVREAVDLEDAALSTTRPTPGTPGGPALTAEAAAKDAAEQQRSSDDLWARVRAGFKMPELDTGLVEDKIEFYAGKPEYLQRMFSRGSRYLYHIVEEIEKRGMPTELALLPFVESAMNPVALSGAKAAGLWQFIPSTGKAYDLQQNWWADNRRDVVQSTRAALDYLQRIYEMQGNDWFLALASYNWGEGAVQRAMRRNQARGMPAGYLDIRMPRETRHYVPKLIALKKIIANPQLYNVDLPVVPNQPYFVTVEKTRPMDLKLAAQFAGMTVDEFVALNPAHNRPVIAATEDNVIKIPVDRAAAFAKAVEQHEADDRVFASWHPYTLKSGESLEEVAARGGVTASELRKANSISPNVRVVAGTRILAPQSGIEDESGLENFRGARVVQVVTVPGARHTVRRRETVDSIARRYGLSPAQLAAMNGGVKRVAPGVSLIVRQPYNQTVVMTETGSRQVLSSERVRGRVIPASAKRAVVRKHNGARGKTVRSRRRM